MGMDEIAKKVDERAQDTIFRAINAMVVDVRHRAGCTISEAARFLLAELREYIKTEEENL